MTGFYNVDSRLSNIFLFEGTFTLQNLPLAPLNSFLWIQRTSNAYQSAPVLPQLHNFLQKDQVQHLLYLLPFE